MIARSGLRFESRLAVSPVWLNLVDTFTGRPPSGPLEVHLTKRVGATWVPLAVPHQISSSGDVGFLNLGRGRPGDTGTFDVRVTISSPRTITRAPTGEAFVESTVPIWLPDAPPKPFAQLVSFVPGPDYGFGHGIPLLSGRVVTSNGDPVDRARVSATEIVRGSAVVEEVMTAPNGWFRLPLRWSAGATQIDAVSGALSGGKPITVPDDLPVIVTITIT